VRSKHRYVSPNVSGAILKQRRFSCLRASVGTSLAIAASAMVMIMTAGEALAETLSPVPEPTTPTPTLAASEPVESNAPSTDDTSTNSEGEVAAKAAGSLSLSVESTGGPVADHFFQDIGSYSFKGSASDLDDGTQVQIYRRGANSGWYLQASTQLSNDAYSVTMPVRERGTFTFVSTTGGVPGSGDEISSNEVTITVEDSKITLDVPVAKIDSLKNPTISGAIVPARRGVEVHIEVKISDTYRLADTTMTDSSGRFSLSFGLRQGLARHLQDPGHLQGPKSGSVGSEQ
jgi:hypothetical protein